MARPRPRTRRQARPPELLVVISKVRDLIRQAGCQTGGDALDGLSARVAALIAEATARARANGRKTVRAHDF